MALLHEAVESKKFDVRVIERNLDRGVISNPDLAKAVSDLPDDAENADYTDVDALAKEGEPSKGLSPNGHSAGY